MVRFCVKTRLVLGRKQKRPATARRRWSHRARFHPPHPRSPGTPHSPATDPLRPRPAMNAIYITKIKTIASGKPLQSGPDPYAEKRIRKKPTNKLKRAYPEIERRLPVGAHRPPNKNASIVCSAISTAVGMRWRNNSASGEDMRSSRAWHQRDIPHLTTTLNGRALRKISQYLFTARRL